MDWNSVVDRLTRAIEDRQRTRVDNYHKNKAYAKDFGKGLMSNADQINNVDSGAYRDGNMVGNFPLFAGASMGARGGIKGVAKITSLKRAKNAVPRGKIGKMIDLTAVKFPEYAVGHITPKRVRHYERKLKEGKAIPPLVTDPRGNILDGAHRLLALQNQGYKKIGSVIQQDNTPAYQFGSNLRVPTWARNNMLGGR